MSSAADQPDGGDLRARWQAARLAATAAASRRLGHDLRGILASALLAAERLQAHADTTVQRSAETIIRAVERATARLAEARQAVSLAGHPPASPQAAASIRLRCCLPVRDDVRTEYAAPEEIFVSGDEALLTLALASVFAHLVEHGTRTIAVNGHREGTRWTIVLEHDGEAELGAAGADMGEWAIASDWLSVLGGSVSAGHRRVILGLAAA